MEELIEGTLSASWEVALVWEWQSQNQVYLQVFLEIGTILVVHPSGEDIK